MASSLSTLINNLSEGIHKINCKYGHDDKKYKTCGVTYEVCDCFLEYENFKDDLIKYNILCCNIASISLFHCCEKVFILTNTWIIGQNSMKDQYLKNEIFIVTKILLMRTQKEFRKVLK